MSKKTKSPHRADGTFRAGNRAAVKGDGARVLLTAQRVAPETLAAIEARRVAAGGRGKVIDQAIAALIAAESKG